ncbi:hypothetical protein C8F01DRAFT_1227714 [Mycena amicta]|nr:hypothetical protein C8F01DRAFT_1227714 [Mycena amicta]
MQQARRTAVSCRSTAARRRRQFRPDAASQVTMSSLLSTMGLPLVSFQSCLSDVLKDPRLQVYDLQIFSTWTPPDVLPERWMGAATCAESDAQTRNDAESSTPVSATVKKGDKVCMMTGAATRLQASHLVPKSESDWFQSQGHAIWAHGGDAEDDLDSSRTSISSGDLLGTYSNSRAVVAAIIHSPEQSGLDPRPDGKSSKRDNDDTSPDPKKARADAGGSSKGVSGIGSGAADSQNTLATKENNDEAVFTLYQLLDAQLQTFLSERKYLTEDDVRAGRYPGF